MKHHRKVRPMLSARALGIRQRLRNSWTSWSLTRAIKRQQKATRRLTLLLQEVDSHLLLQKELRQQVLLLQHRQLEIRLSQQYRQEGKLSP